MGERRIPKRLLAYRRLKGLSREEALADRLGVDETTLWGWETGQHRPSRRHRERIEGLLVSGAAADNRSTGRLGLEPSPNPADAGFASGRDVVCNRMSMKSCAHPRTGPTRGGTSHNLRTAHVRLGKDDKGAVRA